jgi:hypothetical protein
LLKRKLHTAGIVFFLWICQTAYGDQKDSAWFNKSYKTLATVPIAITASKYDCTFCRYANKSTN